MLFFYACIIVNVFLFFYFGFGGDFFQWEGGGGKIYLVFCRDTGECQPQAGGELHTFPCKPSPSLIPGSLCIYPTIKIN